MAVGARGRALTVLAVVLTLLAVSDVAKPLGLEGADTGLVVFGRRLTGAASAVAGLVVGAYLAIYAAGVWGLRRWALPLAWGYAAYVVANVTLFPFRTPQPPDAGLGYVLFGIVYTILAVGGAVTCAVLLGRRRADLR
jgi:hypothetical protein